jgi:cysteine desulfurase/selenocysteine lyase
LRALPGVRLHSPLEPERRAGIITFSLAGCSSETLFQHLRDQQVVCANRGAGIRFSPHFYTAPKIIDEALAVVAQQARG